MFPNSMNNNRNGYPIQYPMNTPTYTYYNPYQNQPIVRNVVEPQYYGHPQQMQPMYFPYVQQNVYTPVFYPPNTNNLPSPQIMNMHHNNRPRRNQEQKRQKFKPKNDVDPSKPESTKDEVRRWIESRMKNFPTKANLLRKEEERKIKEETGELIEPPLSMLEQKLRKKIRVLSMIDGRTSRRKETERNFLLKYVTNPFKKVKCTASALNDDKVEKTEKNEEPTSKIDNEGEVKESPNQKEVYDAFKEFQMQISQMENDKDENNDELAKDQDDDMPLERKCITQKSLDLVCAEKNEKAKTTINDNFKDKKNIREPLLKSRKNFKPVIKPEESSKKNESIDDIIENLKQRKEKDESEFMKLMEGPVKTTDFKYRTNTLLANLLIDDIFNEKNVTLQCLRYIVKENFFDKKE